ncbi:hypothetical protein K438DRAFT_1999949 [Mycena galopus ATCC 62051]|nr:hypothetical protein K438DRAFT_1999949 [Mycena galopus ATCC 62051]
MADRVRREEDEHARASAARPDLVTAELKRAVNARAAVENPQPPTEPQWMMRTSAATLEDPFAAPSHPAFKPTLDDIWNTYFPVYATSDAVDFMGAAAIGNWRSDAGKKAISIARRQWVADQVAGVKFLYRDPTSKSGGYPGELVLRLFASFHLLCLAALERSFSLWKTGTLDNEGTGRKGENPALSFIANPWAQRALRYLPLIQKLSDLKWREIYELASPFLHSDKGKPDDILTDGSSTDDSELAGGLYVDPRSAIIVSDDED